MIPLAAAGLSAGFDHSLFGLEKQWSDAKQAGVVHQPFDVAEKGARDALGNVNELVAHRAIGPLLTLQATQDAAFLSALDGVRAQALLERAAVPIPAAWAKYKADLEKISRKFGAMSPTESEAVDVWIRSGVIRPTFAAGARRGLTAKEVGALTPYLQFLTRDDDRVRDNHAALHEFVAATSWDGWAVECAPPLGWNCRCRLIPIPWRIAIRLGFSTVFPRGTSKLLAFRARGGADPKFDRGLFRLASL